MRTFLTIGLLTVSTCLGARVCVVAPGDRIGEALAKTADCDTVLVKAGTYREGVLHIDRPVVLLGEGRPVIDGEGAGDVIIVAASHVTVRGFVVRGTRVSDMNDNAGITCVSASYLTIQDNLLEGCFFGIHLSSVSQALVSGNTLKGDPTTPENRRANGIHLWKCDKVDVLHNRVHDHRDGIYFEFVTDSRVSENESHHNARYGLHFMFSHRDAYTHNHFHDNGAGVAVMFTHEVVMTDNRFERNRGASAYGLLLKEINDATIERNVFADNTVGLFVDGCNRAQLRDNRFQGNGWAVKLFANSTATTFSSNTFTSNTFDMSTNGDLVLSTLSGNHWDRYRGYDLDHDGKGDVPHHPMSMFALVTERMPFAMVLSRSLMVNLLDQGERIVPTLTPAALEDKTPLMRPPHG